MRFDTYDLYQICNKYNYFTGGTVKQYDKLFELNSNGADTETLATVIWICTPDKELSEIQDELDLEMSKKRNRIALGIFGEMEEMLNEFDFI